MIYFLFGFLALLGQALLLREIAQVFGSHELALAGALASWLLWTAAGSFAAARAKSDEATADHFIPAALAFSALLPANILLARLLPAWMPAGAQPGLFLMLAGPTLLAMPAALASGLAAGFALARLPASFYAREAAGAAIAGLLSAAYFHLFPNVGTLTILAPACLALAAACASTAPSPRRYTAAAAAALCVLALAAAQDKAWRLKPPAGRPEQVAQTTGSRLAMARTAYYEDGRLLHAAEDRSPEEFVHVPLLALKPKPRVLVSGTPGYFLLPELIKHKPARLDLADPDGHRSAFFGKEGVLLGAKMIKADIRSLPAGEKYSAIFQACPAPDTAAMNRYFTAEFFAAAKGLLEPGGLLVFQLPFSANYLPAEAAYAGASVLAAAKDNFDSVILLPGDRLTVIASEKTPDLDPAKLAAAYESRRIKTKTVVPGAFPFMLDIYRRAWAESSLAKAGGVKANRDLEPAAYYRYWRSWLAMVAAPKALLGVAALALAAICAGLLVAGRLEFRARRRTGEAFLMGAWGMALETALLLAYQARTGQLNPELGALFAAFMAAAAAGSALATRLQLNRTWPAEIGAAIISAAAATLITGLAGPGVWALIAGTGFVSGIFFASAASESGGAVYGWDSLGAAAGGFLAAGFAVPLLGIRGALICSAALALAAAAGAVAARYSVTASTVKENS